MASKKTKKGQTAEELTLDFLKLHGISIVLDNTNVPQENIHGILYTVDQRPRVRFFFKKDLLQAEAKPDTGQNGHAKVATESPKMEIN